MAWDASRYIPNSETEYKLNLSRQMDRINILLSTRLEINQGNILQAFKMLVAAQRNAVDALEAMFSPYIDSDYRVDRKHLIKKYSILIKDDDEHNAIVKEQDFVEKKYAALIRCLERKNMLLPPSGSFREGFPIEKVEDVK